MGLGQHLAIPLHRFSTTAAVLRPSCLGCAVDGRYSAVAARLRHRPPLPQLASSGLPPPRPFVLSRWVGGTSTNVIICIYAVIVGWAASYAYYSLTSAWGADPQAFFFKDFLQMADAKDLGLDFVGKVAGPLIAVWVFTLAIMALGRTKGVAGASILHAFVGWCVLS